MKSSSRSPVNRPGGCLPRQRGHGSRDSSGGSPIGSPLSVRRSTSHGNALNMSHSVRPSGFEPETCGLRDRTR